MSSVSGMQAEGLGWKWSLGRGSHAVNELLVCLPLNLFGLIPTESMTDRLD